MQGDEFGMRNKQNRLGLSIRGGVLVFVIISFFGWSFEKIGRYLLYDSVADRGFLSLPLCPIYGTCILMMGLLLGSPSTPSRLFGRLWERTARLPRGFVWGLRIGGYFLAATLLSTSVELAVGLIFRGLGIPLWDYGERSGNLFGVICPAYSLLWGMLITAAMGLIWDRLCRSVERIPRRAQGILAISLTALILLDFGFNCIFVALTGHRFLIF